MALFKIHLPAVTDIVVKLHDHAKEICMEWSYDLKHGVQCRIISVDNFFLFLRLLFFALLLLYET